MKIWLSLFFVSILFSCGNENKVLSHDDSLSQQLIKLPIADQDLNNLIDSSNFIYKAKLINRGVFWTWDFGTSDATHYFRIENCLLGNDTGIVGIRQYLKDQTGNDSTSFCGHSLEEGKTYLLFLKSRIIWNRKNNAVPKDSVKTKDGKYPICVLFPETNTYELADEKCGMLPWTKDIEIRIIQLFNTVK
ncbi:MAG TPA: hypothetical protein VFJ43_10820 [Bacteroidia bacterium]|nr:hypothetical protein [Bacteroidia bacterium]